METRFINLCLCTPHWITGLCEKFRTDFIDQNRWQFLADGFGITMQITVGATIVGLFLGLLLAVIRSTHDKTGRFRFLNMLAKCYLTVIRGTPTMVQLMIIYFVIFGSVDVPKIIVAILGFGINCGAYTAEIIRAGLMAVPRGQFEAGFSLGFSYRQTLLSIVMPQAFKTILPALGNEFITLLKETSISGLIAMQDLTQGGDIIRSQTYDAFLPLIAVALIYLACVSIFSFAISRLEIHLKRNE
ncbi:MAG: amino acid ABC transporter permease [Victivallales bacterium]|nr:amino acid ABC transporter permease [Victivallales bacterium]